MKNLSITISRQNAYDDIRVKSHIDCETIVDATARYKIEAGTEKAEQIHQCISDAFASVLQLVRRFLTPSAQAEAMTTAYDGVSDLSLPFYVSDRRAHYFSATLAPSIHAYVVDFALAKYYASIYPAFAAPYTQRLAGEASAIETIIYTKQPPE